MPTYRNDPRWIIAKYPGKDKNGTAFQRGDKLFYYPLSRTMLAGDAADKASADFDASTFDEGYC